jgi:hypothetical protein
MKNNLNETLGKDLSRFSDDEFTFETLTCDIHRGMPEEAMCNGLGNAWKFKKLEIIARSAAKD